MNNIFTSFVSVLLRKIKRIGILPFHFGKSSYAYTYISYQPDSYSISNEHPEFKYLFEKYILNNHLNNSGDIPRLWALILNIKQIISEGISGDFAELGVFRGNSSAILAHYASIFHRKVYLLDTFSGFDRRDFVGTDENAEVHFSDTSIELVKNTLGDTLDSCNFIPGYFPESISNELSTSIFSIVSLDCDLLIPMKEALDFFYQRMTKGGIFLIHDYSSGCWTGVKEAVDEFCAKNNEFIILIPDKSGSAFIRKSN